MLPTILVIFGATGDLTSRKLVPALVALQVDGALPKNFVCVAFARRPKTDEEFRTEVKASMGEVDLLAWEQLSSRIFYHQADLHEPEGYRTLAARLARLDQHYGTQGNRVYYLSTQPSHFPVVVAELAKSGLIYKKDAPSYSRVVIEKPFGRDLASSQALQDHLDDYLDESQIYRIDHYLGKEAVQNLLVFRFANTIFEALWNSKYIDHVQITVAEDIGIGTRGAYWEETGLIRDMIQNHVMQLLTLVAMEPPSTLSADAIRDEKVKVLHSIRPIEVDNLVRGQYEGYLAEAKVAPHSQMETYAALRLFIDNWRWAGVPFYIRSGKCLKAKATEIHVVFRSAPQMLYNKEAILPSNRLTWKIQPEENISLSFNTKGQKTATTDAALDFSYANVTAGKSKEAYQRLLCDCMLGDSTLFARADEVEGSWKLLTPLLNTQTPLERYAKASSGPHEADKLLARDKRSWID